MGGGGSEVLPQQRAGGGGVVPILNEWVGHNSFWVLLTQELEVLAILKRGRKRFLPFLKLAAKGFTLS